MKRPGQVIFSFVIMGVGIWTVAAAQGWPWKAALFPVVIGIPIVVLAGLEGLLTLGGVEEKGPGHAVDMGLTEDVPPELMRRRTLRTFAWLLGFFGMILAVGFPVAVPLFVFLYLTLEAREKWLLSLALTACAWGIFYGLFVKLIPLPFPEGWVARLFR